MDITDKATWGDICKGITGLLTLKVKAEAVVVVGNRRLDMSLAQVKGTFCSLG